MVNHGESCSDLQKVELFTNYAWYVLEGAAVEVINGYNYWIWTPNSWGMGLLQPWWRSNLICPTSPRSMVCALMMMMMMMMVLTHSVALLMLKSENIVMLRPELLTRNSEGHKYLPSGNTGHGQRCCRHKGRRIENLGAHFPSFAHSASMMSVSYWLMKMNRYPGPSL